MDPAKEKESSITFAEFKVVNNKASMSISTNHTALFKETTKHYVKGNLEFCLCCETKIVVYGLLVAPARKKIL